MEVTLESLLNDPYGYSNTEDSDFEYDFSDVAEAMTYVAEAVEELHTYNCAKTIMESVGMESQTITMEGKAWDAIKRFFRKIRDAIKKFWGWLTGKNKKEEAEAEKKIKEAQAAESKLSEEEKILKAAEAELISAELNKDEQKLQDIKAILGKARNYSTPEGKTALEELKNKYVCVKKAYTISVNIDIESFLGKNSLNYGEVIKGHTSGLDFMNMYLKHAKTAEEFVQSVKNIQQQQKLNDSLYANKVAESIKSIQETQKVLLDANKYCFDGSTVFRTDANGLHMLYEEIKKVMEDTNIEKKLKTSDESLVALEKDFDEFVKGGVKEDYEKAIERNIKLEIEMQQTYVSMLSKLHQLFKRARNVLTESSRVLVRTQKAA